MFKQPTEKESEYLERLKEYTDFNSQLPEGGSIWEYLNLTHGFSPFDIGDRLDKLEDSFLLQAPWPAGEKTLFFPWIGDPMKYIPYRNQQNGQGNA